MKKLNWKRFFKSLDLIEWIELIMILIIAAVTAILIFKFLFIGEPVIKTTPNGESYTCYGGLIKICGGSSEAAKYLGV